MTAWGLFSAVAGVVAVAVALPWLIHAWQVRTGRWQAP